MQRSNIEALSQNPFPLLIVCTLILGGIAVLIPTLAVAIILAVVATLVVYSIYRQRFVAFNLFVFLLPISNLLFILIYWSLSPPASLLRMGLFWEDIIAVIAFVVVLYSTLAWRRWRVPLKGLIALADVLAICQLVLVCIYAFVSWRLYPGLSLVDLVRAMRDQLIYILMYFVGRMTVISELRGWRILRNLAVVAIITSLIGFFERFFIPIGFFLYINAPGFFTDIVGHTFHPDAFGLPENFWTSVGGITVRRATSVYISSQPFAISLSLLIPVCIWLSIRMSSNRPVTYLPTTRAMGLWTLIVLAALVATITRANIALALLQIGLSILLLRSKPFHVNRKLTNLVAVIGISGLILLLIAYRPIIGFVETTLNFTESSSRLHRDSLINDVMHLQARPLGLGIGTAGITAARANINFEGSAGGEGQYSKKIREMGLPGFLLYAGLLATVTLQAYRLFQRNRQEQQSIFGVSFVVFLAGFAFLFNGLTTEWHGAQSTSLVFWWLAGSVVTLSLKRNDDAAHRA
jgi:hypothetical protein